MNIKIKKNDYVIHTEPREEIVQAICDAFIKRDTNYFFPLYGGAYRNSNTKICVSEDDTYFTDKEENEGKNIYKIRECEMRIAFKLLIEAGYHMMTGYPYSGWKGYCCSKTPNLQDWHKVETFTEHWD